MEIEQWKKMLDQLAKKREMLGYKKLVFALKLLNQISAELKG
jgi:hypothetical protein